jgi:hypothetical protein
VFAAIDMATAALAFPLLPDAIVIQPCDEVAVQPQPVNVVTFTDNEPPAKPMLSPVRLSEN